MKTGTIAALGVGGILVGLVVGSVLWVYLRPLSVYAWMGRRTLRAVKLAEVAVDTPAGRQRAFVGGAGEVVVLLHGAGDQAGAWSRLAPQ